MALPLCCLPWPEPLPHTLTLTPYRTMARITRQTLYRETLQACRALGLAPEALWAQHSGTGWHIYRQVGPGALPLGECLTAREALCLLQGLALAPTLQQEAQ